MFDVSMCKIAEAREQDLIRSLLRKTNAVPAVFTLTEETAVV